MAEADLREGERTLPVRLKEAKSSLFESFIKQYRGGDSWISHMERRPAYTGCINVYFKGCHNLPNRLCGIAICGVGHNPRMRINCLVHIFEAILFYPALAADIMLET